VTGARRRAAGALRFCVAGLLLSTACTSSTKQFCGRLEELYTFDDLNRAIETQDQTGIASGLDDMRRLEEVAPAEIHDDLRQINDAMIDVIREVTDSPGPEGQTAPVDLDALRDALTAVGDSLQHVTDYADKECGLTL
jgi:hypothetical protein